MAQYEEAMYYGREYGDCYYYEESCYEDQYGSHSAQTENLNYTWNFCLKINC